MYMKLTEITGIKDKELLVEYLNTNGIFNFPSATLNPETILDEIERKTSSYIALTKYVIHLIFTNEEKRNAVFAELGLSPLRAQEKYNCKRHNIFTPEYWYAAKYYKITDTMKLSDVVLSDKEYKALEDLNNCCQIADLFDPNLAIGDIRELIDIIGLATPNNKTVSNDIETLRDLANYHNYGRKYPFNLIRDTFCYRLDQNYARNIIKLGVELTQMIEDSLKTLTHERDAEFIYKLYKDGMTMADIGKENGITKERVRELICRGLRQLRHPSRSKMILPLLSLKTDDIGFIAIKKFISNPDTKGSKILNIITDNTPSSAYELISTNNFIKHLILQGNDVIGIMTSINIELTNDDIEKYDIMVDNEKRRSSLETPIEDLDLSIRSFNCLKRAGVKTVQDILSLINKGESPFDALWKVRNLGRRGSIEVLEKLVEIHMISPDALKSVY